MLPLFFAAILALGATPSQETVVSSPSPNQDGALAPANCWTIEGGCVARTAAARTRGPRAPIAVAWEYTPKGEIEGEPLVWDQRVLLTVKESEEKRSLVFLQLASGKPIANLAASFKTTMPLQPSIWANLLLARTGPNEIKAFRISSWGLQGLWTYKSQDAASRPMIFKGEIYVMDGASLRRLSLGGSVLRTVAEACVAAPAIRGSYIYAGTTWSNVAQLVRIHRETNARDELSLFPIPSGGMSPEKHALAVFEKEVFIHFAETGISWMVGKSGPDPDAEVEGRAYAIPLLGQAVETDGGWIVIGKDKEEKKFWARKLENEGKEKYQIIANEDAHAELLKVKTPPSRAADLVFLGPIIFEQDSLRILWRGETSPRRRAVPARESVLLAEPKRLLALRSAKGQEEAQFLDAQLGAGAIAGGKGVMRDGTVLREGTLKIDAKGTLSSDKTKGNWLREEVLWLEDGKGALKFAGPAGAGILGLELFAEREQADQFAALAIRAAKLEHPELLPRFLEKAWLLGSSDPGLMDAEKKLPAILAKKSGMLGPEFGKTIAAEGKTAEFLPARTAWDRYQALPAACPKELRFDLLRMVVRVQPDHPQACAEIRKMIPDGIQAPEPFESADWIDFVEAVEQTPIRILKPEEKGDPSTAAALDLYRKNLKEWRNDLVAIRSRNLFVITPLKAPGRIARCLSLGELVCGKLEELFFPDKSKPREMGVLALLLFETKEEYIKFSTKDSRARHALAWTAGHYSPVEDLARIFLPPTPDAFEQVMDVYAHELTHHWLDRQLDEMGRVNKTYRENFRAVRPGYWIVEGFACYINESFFDLRKRTIAPDPHGERIDTIANLDPRKQIPWDELFAMSHAREAGLKDEPTAFIPMTWHLGKLRGISATTAFYAQGAAACRYLLEAEEGKHREKLLQYVRDYYAANGEKLEFAQVFGADPDDLGMKITDYAKSLAASR